MPRECVQESASVGIPEPEGVVARACECVSIRSKRNAVDSLMSSESSYVSTGVGIPEPEGVVRVSAYERVSIRGLNATLLDPPRMPR